ncbi:flagellar basal-body MS-ring/collar protein FliF [Roseobacter sp.]|uniref:flagellar basal-body MS-ring/collar protein FliF n=1 Tax=Roseobacter sp. TaxID=1907202 RepID=UPI00385B92D0
MNQLAGSWAGLGLRRQIIVAIATIAVFAAVLMMSRMASKPSMSLLYAGLESSQAGEVIRALEQRGAVYEVRGGAIFVASNSRDQFRMTLASEGLPANVSGGYELLDQLTGFGTTSQMFDAAYWRAKEGELARTIMASPHIKAARVHIANQSSTPFQREIGAKASVSVTTSAGSLSVPQAKALKYLVASAVAGMLPEDVSVIDGTGGLISSGDELATNPAGDDKADAMRARIERLLEARVGYGNAVVEVSVETNTDRESIVERRFDPENRVAISTDTEERSTSANDSGGGDVTVASNLPDGDGAGDRSSSSTNSETRERINFEVSETQRELVRAPGALKRITVAVLVNGTTAVDAEGVETFSPRSEEEMSALRELVASAVGFDEERGDVITLKSMEFEPIVMEGTVGAPSLLDQINLDVMSLVQLAVLALVALVLGLFVVKPVLATANTPAPALPPPGTGQSDTNDDKVLTGEIQDDADPMPDMAMAGGGLGDLPDLPGLPDLGGMGGMGAEDPVGRLRQLISDREDETVELLRSWMEDEEEAA